MNPVRSLLLAILLAGLSAAVPGAQKPATPAVMLEAARQKATLEGDLRGAIRLYQQVVDQYSKTDRPVAATALFSLAECLEKLGDPAASKFFHEVVAKYADQKAVAAAAQSRLNTADISRLICDQCADVFGSVSDDGRFMATVPEEMMVNGDIGVRDLSTGVITPLQIEGSGKQTTGVPLSPIFSPDDRRIAYTWAMGNRGAELRIVAREVHAKARTVVNDPQYAFLAPFGWSPDGSIVASALKADDTAELIKVSVATGAVTTLKSLGWRMGLSSGVRSASLSRDGRFVAYEALAENPTASLGRNSRCCPDSQIYVVGANGGAEMQITTGAGAKKGPVWSADGSYVLYTGNVTGQWDLWAMSVREGRPAGMPMLVKKNIGQVVSIGMAATGLYHYYEGRAGVISTTVATVGAVSPRAGTSADRFIGARPVWSPDGRTVAVNRPRSDAGNDVNIVVRTLASGDERVFSREGISNFPYIWFPDGSALLAVVREANNENSWYRLNLANGAFQKLTAAEGDMRQNNIRALSQDGRTLFLGAYLSPGGPGIDRIVALDLESGSRREVFRLPVSKESLPRAAQDFALATSPDGQSLAMVFYNRATDATHLAVVGTDGQGYRELTTPVRARNLRNKLVWSRDGKWIYVTTRVGDDLEDKHRIMRIPAAGGALQETGIDAEGLESFDLSPDGTRVAYSTLRPEGAGQLLWALDVQAILKAAR